MDQSHDDDDPQDSDMLEPGKEAADTSKPARDLQPAKEERPVPTSREELGSRGAPRPQQDGHRLEHGQKSASERASEVQHHQPPAPGDKAVAGSGTQPATIDTITMASAREGLTLPSRIRFKRAHEEAALRSRHAPQPFYICCTPELAKSIVFRSQEASDKPPQEVEVVFNDAVPHSKLTILTPKLASPLSDAQADDIRIEITIRRGRSPQHPTTSRSSDATQTSAYRSGIQAKSGKSRISDTSRAISRGARPVLGDIHEVVPKRRRIDHSSSSNSSEATVPLPLLAAAASAVPPADAQSRSTGPNKRASHHSKGSPSSHRVIIRGPKLASSDRSDEEGTKQGKEGAHEDEREDENEENDEDTTKAKGPLLRSRSKEHGAKAEPMEGKDRGTSSSVWPLNRFKCATAGCNRMANQQCANSQCKVHCRLYQAEVPDEALPCTARGHATGDLSCDFDGEELGLLGGGEASSCAEAGCKKKANQACSHRRCLSHCYAFTQLSSDTRCAYRKHHLHHTLHA